MSPEGLRRRGNKNGESIHYLPLQTIKLMQGTFLKIKSFYNKMKKKFKIAFFVILISTIFNVDIPGSSHFCIKRNAKDIHCCHCCTEPFETSHVFSFKSENAHCCSGSSFAKRDMALYFPDERLTLLRRLSVVQFSSVVDIAFFFKGRLFLMNILKSPFFPITNKDIPLFVLYSSLLI